MKITCSSCGSKYTIADAKVQGKKVKVRCKSCKESILVDGTDVSSTGSDDSDDDAEDVDSPALGANTAKGKDVWSVNLSDDDSREMTLEELLAAWKSGLLTSDAYVWKDGMSDWKPILEVGELKLKLGPAPARGVTSSAGKAMPKAKANDLFGALEAGPAPGAGPKAQEAKPTGARNDSSVLFSLDSLNSPGGASGSSNVSANIFGDLAMAPPTLTTETDLLMAPPKAPPAAPVGARAVSLPAAPPRKSGKGLLIGAIVGGLLVAGGAVFALSGSSKGDADASAQATQATQEAEQAKAELERAKKMQEEAEKLKADLERAKKEAEEAEKQKAAAAASADPKAGEPKPADDKAKPSEEGAKTAGGTAAPAGSPSPSPSPAPSGGGAFNVEAAKGALSAAAAQAAACAKPGGPTGSGKVQVTFSTSGRVTSANVVSGPFGGTSVGGCVASTFRRARVPAFSGGPKTVSKSFSIR